MADEYDMIVIGAGSGGIVAARFAAQLEASVALVEAFRPGGDCLYTGCVPSKALIRAAKVAWDVRHADHYGVEAVAAPVDLARVMLHVREVIQRVYQFESVEALREEGIDVHLGTARFLDPHTIAVGEGVPLRGKRFLICTGARPSVPPIPGLDRVPYLTYQTVFDLQKLPERLLVIGAGPVGLELAQAFLRLGSHVTCFSRSRRILSRADPEISTILTQALTDEGMTLRTETKIERVEVGPDGAVTVHDDRDGVIGDALLVATGRRPNVDDLALSSAGVSWSDNGIAVDDQLRTNQSHIYACGDVVGREQFTHYAAWQGFMAVRNALLPGYTRGTSDRVPWTIFTDPEVARVGLTEREARERYGDEVRVALLSMDRVDRAQTEHDALGTIKIVVRGKGDILGAHIVAARAGEMIHEYVLALDHGLRMSDLARPIHVYPTFSTGNQQVASEYSTAATLRSSTGKIAKAIGERLR